MTIYDFLVKLTGGLTGLIDLLRQTAAAVPDLAPVCEKWIAALETMPDSVNLAVVGAAIPGEILKIVKGEIDPHDHPSDAI